MAILRVLRPVLIDGAQFDTDREHEVDQAVADHWLIKDLIASGEAFVEPDVVEAIEPEKPKAPEKPEKSKPKQGGDADGADKV